MVLAEDLKPGWSYFEYKYLDITLTDIPTIIEKISRLEAAVCKLTARANTTDEILDILLAEEEENGPGRAILEIEEERNTKP
jgi:hypothetical protein